MAEYLSNRVKKKFGTGVSTTRYDYLSLDQAEPDLGNPLVGPSSIGAKPYPNGGAYILASFAQTDKSDRYWVPPSALSGLGLGVIPGAFTIRDENVLVGAASSFTTLNFIGPGVSVDFVSGDPSEQTGVATVRITSPAAGTLRNIQYHGADDQLAGSSNFVFDYSTNRVGIGSTLPGVALDIGQGAIRGTGISTLTTLFSNSVTSNTLLINSTASFNTISIGSTEVVSSSRQLRNIASLDATTTATIEAAIANAPNAFTDLTVTGVSTFNGLVVANGGLQIGGGSSLASLSVSGISTFGYIQATGINVSGVTTTSSLSATNANISGIATIGIATVGTINATNSQITSIKGADAAITGITTTNDLKAKYANVSTAGTIANFFATNATVSGLTSTGSVYTNTVTTTSNVSIGGSLTVDTNTLIVDSVANGVGLGTTPGHRLHVQGDFRVSDLVYVSNGRGITGQVLISQGPNPPVWGAPDAVTVGAAQSIYLTNNNTNSTHFLTFSESSSEVGYLNVDTNGLVYNPSTNRLGIGSTSPAFNVDVLGDVNFTGTLYQNGELYVASRWAINESNSNIWRLSGNVGVGTSALNHKFTVKGNTLLDGITFINDGYLKVGVITASNIHVGSAGTIVSVSETTRRVGLGTTEPRSTLEIVGEGRINGVAHFEGSITEKITNTFNTNIPSTNGVMTIDASAGTVVVGILTEAVSTWAFTGVNTEAAKATTVTLIIDSNSLLGYGETCIVNGTNISGGVRWGGGIAPLPTNNEDILSFTIATDSTGTIRVYGSSALNFS
jgi:hypothetical protein